jgi:DNA-binding NtrC family response regulator
MTAIQKILICDEEEGTRESLKLILGDHYDLILTDSGEQCLECLEHGKTVGLVLLDIKIPKVNDRDILKIIKEKYPILNVIITGYKSVETAHEATSLGACGYIIKPFKSDEILKAVRKLIKA